MRKAIGILAFSLLTGTSAYADDISAPAVAPIQAVNWTSLYIGGNAGGAIAHAVGTSNFTDTSLPAGSNLQTIRWLSACARRFSRRRASRR
jgi:hypothetical protein